MCMHCFASKFTHISLKLQFHPFLIRYSLNCQVLPHGCSGRLSCMVTSLAGSSFGSSMYVGNSIRRSLSSWCKSYMISLGMQSCMVTDHLGLTDDAPGKQSCMVTNLSWCIVVYLKHHWCIEQTDKENGTAGVSQNQCKWMKINRRCSTHNYHADNWNATRTRLIHSVVRKRRTDVPLGVMQLIIELISFHRVSKA